MGRQTDNRISYIRKPMAEHGYLCLGLAGSRSAAVRGRDGIQCPQPGQYAGRRAVDVLFEHIIFRGVADVRMEIF